MHLVVDEAARLVVDVEGEERHFSRGYVRRVRRATAALQQRLKDTQHALQVATKELDRYRRAAAQDKASDAALRSSLETALRGSVTQIAQYERRIAELAAFEWCTIEGRVAPEVLLEAYRSAWIVASASRAETFLETFSLHRSREKNEKKSKLFLDLFSFLFFFILAFF